MAAIAIIDDNTEQSDTVKTNIEIELEKIDSSIKVITSQPFREIKTYFDFIEKNQVCVLILDEKLNDQPIDDQGPIDYKGSELITILRKALKDLPIYALTTYATDYDVTQKDREYEGVIKRGDFYNNADQFVPKFWRAAKNFLKENIDEFSEYNELAKAVSGGNSDPELLKKLQALQVKLELPFSGFDDRNTWLNEYEKQISELTELNNIIKAKLNN